VDGLSQGIRRRFAAAGVSAVMAGGLLFGMTGTAEATPAATAAPTTVSAPVALVAATSAAPTAASVTANWDQNWKKKKRCHRVWHRASWYWWNHHRSFKRGWWSCRYW
jgi:hypothetical protein